MPACGGKSHRRWEIPAVARRRWRSSRGGTEERESIGGEWGVTGRGWEAGVYIGPGPRDSCPPSQPLVLIAETLIHRHVSGGKKVTSVKQCTRCESCPRRNYVPKFTADFYGMIQRISEISLKLKLHRLIRYLRWIDRWRKEEHQEAAIQTQNRRWAMEDILHQRRGMAGGDGDLEVPWGLLLGIYQTGIPAM
jgi:hypothetical protein